MTWWIKGETGKTLDATRRVLPDLKVRDATARFGVLESDWLTWTARTRDVDAGQTIIPDVGQKISLYLDETRVFHGNVTDPRLDLYGTKIRAEGPWWWLRRQEVLTSINDEAGNPGDRPRWVFSQANLQAHLQEVLTKAITDGLPIALGTVPSIYEVPAMSFSLTSFADVISGLLDWCPDAVAWFDHSAEQGEAQAATATTIELEGGASVVDDFYNGLEIEIRSGANVGETRVITDYVGATRTATVAAWTITPSAGDDYTIETPAAFNVTRRGAATAKTIVVGTDKITEFDLSPVSELQVGQVRLPYASVNGSNEIAWEEQASGVAAPGKVWVITIAGPETVDFLPSTGGFSDDLNIELTTTDLATAVKEALDGYAGLEATYPEGGTGWIFSVADTVTTKTVTHSWSEATEAGKSWANPAVPAGKSFIFFEEGQQPPQWAIDGFGLTRYSLTHLRYVDGNSPTSTPAYDGARSGDLDQFFLGTYYWYSNSKTDPNAIGSFEYAWLVKEFRDEEFQMWMIPTANIPGTGKLSRSALDSFSFLSPNSGLAANLLAASNWLPYEGRIVLSPGTITPEAILSKKINVTGHVAALATAGALPRAYELDLDAATVTIELGAPARKDFRSLVNRAVIDGSATLAIT